MSRFINLLEILYPTHSIYFSYVNISPAEFIGGTWVAIDGYFIRGANNTQIGGEDQHQLSVTEMPAHHHVYDTTPLAWSEVKGSDTVLRPSVYATNSGVTRTTANMGSGLAHNNMPLYQNLFIWRRIA